MNTLKQKFRLVMICMAAILILAAGVFYQSFYQSEYTDVPPTFLFANDFTGSVGFGYSYDLMSNFLNSSDLKDFIPETYLNQTTLLNQGWNFVWVSDSSLLFSDELRITNVYEFDSSNLSSLKNYGFDPLNEFDITQLKKGHYYWIKLDNTSL